MKGTMDAIAGTVAELGLELGELRQAISKEYEEVAINPERGFHFHTGRPLTRILGYKEEWLEGIPESAIESFAGTGNPFSLGEIRPGERVIDIGCGAGIDSLIAAKNVGSDGKVIGIDMTEAMLDKARQACEEAGLSQVEFRYGHAENLPVPDGWADVVISNGVINLTPDKKATFREMARALNPKGRLQIGDILVQKKVPEGAKRKIDLWTG
jgi:SAM-dependent methyltransferase